MQPGTLIAVIIAIVILLAIWWFMSRAGRQRAARRYAEDARGANAAERGAPDGRAGHAIVTESAGAGTVATAAPAADGRDTFAGAEPSGTPAPAGVAGMAAVGTAGAAAAAAIADKAGRARSAGRSHDAGHHDDLGSDERAHDDLGRDDAAHGGTERQQVDEHGHPNAPSATTASSAGPAAATSAASGPASPSDDAAQREAMPERPRFDASNDGHPVPRDRHVAGTGSKRSPTTDDLPSAQPALSGDFSVDTGDTAADIREMIKILNLRDSEADRLHLSTERFEALRHGNRDGIDDETLTAVADRLRRMLR